jgi:hypothetical protein
MREPRRLTTVLVSTARYRDNFSQACGSPIYLCHMRAYYLRTELSTAVYGLRQRGFVCRTASTTELNDVEKWTF